MISWIVILFLNGGKFEWCNIFLELELEVILSVFSLINTLDIIDKFDTTKKCIPNKIRIFFIGQMEQEKPD